jgi:alpha-L-rhamnosidase
MQALTPAGRQIWLFDRDEIDDPVADTCPGGTTVDRSLSITDLRVEYRPAPIGIDVRRPRLSWRLESAGRNVLQARYRIRVASSAGKLAANDADLWDSGDILSSQAAQVEYGGRALTSREQVWWSVEVEDTQGEVATGSSTWEMGLLRQTDWRGRWISLPGLAPDDAIPEARELDALLPASIFRRQFEVDGEVTRATLYATARGVYVARLNGERIGDQVLAPGWTDYNARIQYQTFDVTNSLKQGANILGAEVGTGWYAGYVGWQGLCRHYGTTPQVLLQLHVDYADGRQDVLATDRTWEGGTGPIRYSDFIMGEWYDARLAGDWSSAANEGGTWQGVQDSAISAVPLVADVSEPVRAMEDVPAISMNEVEPGRWIFDLGANIAGWVRLQARGDAGTQITLRHAEILQPDGSLYTVNLRSARATDTFILAGTGAVEVFEPSFTWHGFRYVEVTGLPGTPDLSAVTGRFVGSDTERAGTFRCSDDLVNTLQDNIVRGQRGNFLSIPTDCPQRDERLGWMGDAQAFIGTAVGNMHLAAFFTKWMQDVEDAQDEQGAFPDVAPRAVDLAVGAPAWADAGVIVPWTIWRTYGDTRIIERHWPAMVRWMDWLERGNPDHLWNHDRGNDFGDWLSIEADTPKELIGTAYWAYDARLMAEMAAATGRTDDATRFQAMFDAVRDAFRAAYLRPDGSLHGETQTCYCLALHFGLLTGAEAARATDLLVAEIERKNGHLSTGFVGVSYLCRVLSANGRADVAYRLLHQQTFPSWKYSILHGATTIWERWDGWTEEKGFQDPGMNSFNHYSLGSVGEWLRRSVAGIDQPRDAAGHQRLRLAPQIDDSLEWAEGTYESMAGEIVSRWDRAEGLVRYTFTVPANVVADVELETRAGDIVECEPAASRQGSADGTSTYSIGSGEWTFVVRR